MPRSKTIQINDGDLFKYPKGWIFLVCCDCGLTHVVKFSRTVTIQWWRDDSRTAARRRSKKLKPLTKAIRQAEKQELHRKALRVKKG